MYTVTSLSKEARAVAQTVFEELEKKNLVKLYGLNKNFAGHAARIGAINQKKSRGICVGYRMVEGKRRYFSDTARFKDIYAAAKRLMKVHNPNFGFSSIYITKNIHCKKHIDGKNRGEACLIGVGTWKEGGKTSLYLPKGKVEVNIKNRCLRFNGSKIYHSSSKAYKGTRYCLVYFSNNSNYNIAGRVLQQRALKKK